jgi:RNA polymerase-binding protein DksA
MAHDPGKLGEMKTALEAERSRLMKELEEHSRVIPLEDETGSNVDPEVQADEAEEFTNRLAAGDALRARINEIDSAINKINMGAYGKCAKCGTDIPLEALKASPARTHCVACQKELNA